MSITVRPREVKNTFFERPVHPKAVNQLGAARTSEADNIEKYIQSMSVIFVTMSVCSLVLIGPIIVSCTGVHTHSTLQRIMSLRCFV